MIIKSDLLEFLLSCLIISVLASPIILFERSAHPVQYSGYHTEEFNLPFSIASPYQVYIMPNELKEISGLAMLDDRSIYAVNDEESILFLYDLKTRKILSKLDFGKDNDHEGLASNNNLVYVLESNGKIRILNTTTKTKIEEFETPLSRRNDVEGICYDSIRNQLLLACKGELEKGKSRKGIKGIYSFDLSSQSFSDVPYLMLDLKAEIRKLKPINIGGKIIQKLTVNSRINMFAPSGLALDPITNDLYVLANKGNTLVVIDISKKILGVYFLSQSIYSQPEGIVFDSKGNLYISNEGKSKEANIVSLMRKTM